MDTLRYTPPTDDIFQEIKSKAIAIWETYDDTHGYATGKINKIKDLPNESDNAMYIWQMFDTPNQMKLSSSLGVHAKYFIFKRIFSEDDSR